MIISYKDKYVEPGYKMEVMNKDISYKINIDGKVIDLGRLAELGNEGVLALLSDSTNSERPGFSASEKIVGEWYIRKDEALENGVVHGVITDVSQLF